MPAPHDLRGADQEEREESGEEALRERSPTVPELSPKAVDQKQGDGRDAEREQEGSVPAIAPEEQDEADRCEERQRREDEESAVKREQHLQRRRDAEVRLSQNRVDNAGRA